MLNISKRHWPLFTASAVLWIITATCLVLSVKQNQGHLVYSIDDAYIHMAMVKNLLKHGVWGVTKYGFSAASSSLLWPLLLSATYLLFGINEISPFILNLIFGTLVEVSAYLLLRKSKCPPFLNLLILLAIIFFTPLVPVMFIGMEHTLHMLISILFVYLSAQILAKDKAEALESAWLLTLAPLLTMARYEGLFVLFMVSCLFVAKRKPRYALYLAGAGLLPLVIYGLFSLSKGWYFLPSSLILKGRKPNFSSLKSIASFLFGYDVCKQIMQSPPLLILMLGGLSLFYLQYRRQKGIWKTSTIMLLILIGTIYLHLQFIGIYWFYRYEAYLVVLGLLVAGIALADYLPPNFRLSLNKASVPQYLILGFLLLLSGFMQRGAAALISLPQFTTNTYQQQYQMGRFLGKFYPGKTVAAEDIGAINYLADIKCFDLLGLADIGVAKAVMEGRYNSKYMYELAKSKNVSIGVMDAKRRFIGSRKTPPPWTKVGQWKIQNNVSCSDDTVSFYAIDPAQADNLAHNLRAFAPFLPKEVIQMGQYTQQTATD